jgi:multidrug resistance efflux pump
MENKDKLPPIPTPASQRWREFRIQVLPVVVFGATVFCIAYLWKNFVQPVGMVGLARTNTVNVTCTVDGMITQLLVDQFQTVTQGQVVAIVQTADADLITVQTEAAVADLEVLRERIKVTVERSEQGSSDTVQICLKRKSISPATSPGSLRCPTKQSATPTWSRETRPPIRLRLQESGTRHSHCLDYGTNNHGV